MDRPLADLHADAIDVHLTFDGAFAALGIVKGSQAYIVSLPRDVLEEFIVRAVDKLAADPLPRRGRNKFRSGPIFASVGAPVS